jgi:hypothetical protein
MRMNGLLGPDFRLSPDAEAQLPASSLPRNRERPPVDAAEAAALAELVAATASSAQKT